MLVQGYKSPIAIHPGETIKETLEVLGITQVDLSIRTGLAEKTISEILNGKNPITPESALKFERILGISREGLIEMQKKCEDDKLRIKEESRLKKEIKYLEKFSCYPELVSWGFIEEKKDKMERVEQLLSFFSVNSFFLIEKTIPVAFRRLKSKKIKVNEESLATWLRVGEIIAKSEKVEEFDEQKLRKNLTKMRALTTEKPKIYSKELKKICSECGIILIYTPCFKNTHVNGASRWITPNKALIQISLRNKYADIFWFTFFHEIGHILKHSKKKTFVNFEEPNRSSEIEEEADNFAQKVLIPSPASYDKFKKGLTTSNFRRNIIEFANFMKIDVGIVAGRIGRETKNWKRVTPLRKKLSFNKKVQPSLSSQ
jgi:HTH-type transcriptional regulator / antitoxin HigA